MWSRPTSNRLLVGGSVISERALLDEVGGFDATQHFYEDHDLWFRMALRSNADVVPTVLLHIRKHNEHYSDTDRLGAAECKAELLNRMLANVEQPSLRQIIHRRVDHAPSGRCSVRLLTRGPTRPGGSARCGLWPHGRCLSGGRHQVSRSTETYHECDAEILATPRC